MPAPVTRKPPAAPWPRFCTVRHIWNDWPGDAVAGCWVAPPIARSGLGAFVDTVIPMLAALLVSLDSVTAPRASAVRVRKVMPDVGAAG